MKPKRIYIVSDILGMMPSRVYYSDSVIGPYWVIKFLKANGKRGWKLESLRGSSK